jgi:hypothetical protein
LANVAQNNDDIRVIIEGDDSGVQTLPDGTIAVDQPDGGVVVQLNPQRADQSEADDPAKFYANIADRIDDGKLLTLANELYEAVDADDKSRSEWLANYAAGMDLLGLTLQDPSTGDGSAAVDGQSVVTNPLLAEAILKGWANAQAELLPAEGPCKIADYDANPVEQKDELAETLQRDMNYFLTTIATEFGPETSHMLLWGCYFSGSGFKKVYTHPLKNRPCSEEVSPEKLIVSDATKDFQSCERITHQITMRQSVMKRYQVKGIYRDVVLAPPTPEPNQVEEQKAANQGVALRKDRPEDQPYTLWEIQCELDLEEFAPKQFKGKGVPLPYLVTMDKDSMTILSVRRDWKPEDEDCTRKKMYVKYPYVPGPGFYGTGLLNILGNSSAALTAAWRIGLDTGMYANFPSFLMDKLAGRQNTSDFKLSPGTGQGIETGGRDIRQVVMDLPYKDVTAGLLSLVDKITEQSKSVGGAPDIPVGEGMQNIPVGTMLAHIEQATKVMAAAHKGQHRAMDEELSMIADLFRENPESFWKGNKKAKGYWTVQKLLQALEERTLVPKSDPNVPSHIHRVMKAVALVELVASPLGVLIDKNEALRRVLVAMREDPTGLVLPPVTNAPPSPDEITANAKMLSAQNDKTKNEIAEKELAAKPQLENVKTEGMVKGKTIDLAKALITHSGEREDAAHGQKMDLAEHTRNLNKDAVDATKVTTDALKTKHEIGMAGQKHGLDMMKTHADIGQAAEQHGLEKLKTHADIGLKSQQLGLAHRQQDLAEGEAAHGAGIAQQKVGIDGAKLDIDQQSADTKTHTAFNPPKPAGAKPKKKK